MNKKILTLGLMLMAGLGATAQVSLVNPVPQEVTAQTALFEAPTQWQINADKKHLTGYIYDALMTASPEVVKKAPFKVTLGVRGEGKVSKYRKNIPAKSEGYFMKVTEKEVVIAGNDGAGTFYGVQSFLQIVSQPQVMEVAITDYPSVPFRGLVEGYYGNPYSEANRMSLFEMFGRQKMNTYIYGPKDDVYHRGQWRENYPADQAEKIREYVNVAKANKVDFVWAIHPGENIQWNKADSVNIVNKLKFMYGLGVRTFAVFFDDVWGEGARGDKQAGLLNYLTDNFVRKHKDVEPLIMCPSQYNKGWTSGDYLNTLGTKMYPEVRIMWTGNSVVDMIEENDMQWINDQIKRKAYIWLNYPVNDYCQSRILMGKTYGNGLDINDMVSGFCSNPMEYAEASKVSLYSIADYTWNMPAYDSVRSWERALGALMPTSADAFRVFCENNVDLGRTGHGLRREGESPTFMASSETIGGLAESFQQLVWAADNLLADEVNNPEMLAEIKPWVESMRLLGQRGQQYVSMVCDLANKDSVAFIGHYRAQLQLEQKQKAIISRNYEGSIVKAKPVVSGDVITPWLNENLAELIKVYKKQYTYGQEYFPVQAIADGEYFIKVNGEYLTNAQAGADRVGDFPVFQAERDVINPQRQQWVIEQNSKTGRYKIYNKQDGRYINETGAFWFHKERNPFDAQWHTYLLVKQEGKWSIQNAGAAGNGYWQREGNRLGSKGTGQFIFEIEKVN